MPAYEMADLIERQLDALAPQVVALDGEIVVVDDASSDGTGAVAAGWAAGRPEVRCTVVRARRRGFSNASRNAGARLAAGDFLAFTDGDDVVRDGWLAALVAAQGPNTLVGGRFVTPGRPEPRGLLPFYRLPQGVALGSSMGFGRDVFDAVGGFDRSFRYGGDEIEFFLTAQLLHGARFREAPDAVIDYRIPTTRVGRRRRQVAFQRGSAIIARRVRRIPGAPEPGFRLWSRVRTVLGSAVRAVVGSERGRAEELDRVRVEATAAWWIVRFAGTCPPPRRADPASVDAGYVVLHGHR